MEICPYIKWLYMLQPPVKTCNDILKKEKERIY